MASTASHQVYPPSMETSICPQAQSSFYTRLPREIRDLIYQHALTPPRLSTPSPSPSPTSPPLYPSTSSTSSPSSYSRESLFARPGLTSPPPSSRALSSLGLASRLTHAETSLLPAAFTPHTFFLPPSSGPDGSREPEAYFARMSAAQKASVREVRVFGAQEWLEGGGLRDLCAREEMRGVRRLKVVVRWCGWRNWERNGGVGLEPWGKEEKEDEEEEEEREERGDAANEDKDKEKDMWGSAFAQLSALKTLEMGFEVPADKRSELDSLVAAAKSWTFPLGADGLVLRCMLEVEWMTWEGPQCAWSDFCPHCCTGGEKGEEDCNERRRRRRADLGPLLHMATLNWMVEKVESAWEG